MKTTLSKLTAIFLAVLLSAGALAQEKVTLSLKYEKGRSYRYKTENAYEATQEVNGSEMKMSGSSRNLVNMVPDQVDTAGAVSFIVTYEEMTTTMKNAMFDTVMEMKELIGKRGRVTYSKSGRELRKEVLDSIPPSKQMGSGGKESLFSVNLVNLPDHPVGPGDKWESEIDDSTAVGDGMIRSKGKKEYTLAGPEMKNGRSCVKITFTARKESTGNFRQNGMEMVVEGSDETTGTLWFDPSAGILVCKESTTQSDMTYAMTGQVTMSVPSVQVIRSAAVLVEN